MSATGRVFEATMSCGCVRFTLEEHLEVVSCPDHPEATVRTSKPQSDPKLDEDRRRIEKRLAELNRKVERERAAVVARRIASFLGGRGEPLLEAAARQVAAFDWSGDLEPLDLAIEPTSADLAVAGAPGRGTGRVDPAASEGLAADPQDCPPPGWYWIDTGDLLPCQVDEIGRVWCADISSGCSWFDFIEPNEGSRYWPLEPPADHGEATDEAVAFAAGECIVPTLEAPTETFAELARRFRRGSDAEAAEIAHQVESNAAPAFSAAALMLALSRKPYQTDQVLLVLALVELLAPPENAEPCLPEHADYKTDANPDGEVVIDPGVDP